ncbi:uncharacterized protein LOC120259400 isoform X1 [Dioscorea cayenensis subsp. rotundata]|uniref:Uncharacterized protein LOC120259400 isoform X1 n=1 Tax=Dioscorea cayennensis subsp. rotundata TaxID=55577 RepID=A0AB40B6H6_DIOCR|nr:uncharacterized protein LOC120259400 isoform X1 [Dioscorea cayenensis subsp. rotundata]
MEFYSPESSKLSAMKKSEKVGKAMDEEPWPRRSKSGVMLEGYVDESVGLCLMPDGGETPAMGRTKSLTDEDLEELKGCLDLGFGFSYDGIPELCGTLPALELCYSLSQRFLDEQHQYNSHEAGHEPPYPLANWKISSPGDHPEDVKARLKYWAQAVACTIRLCS